MLTRSLPLRLALRAASGTLPSGYPRRLGALPGQTFVFPSSTMALSRGFCQGRSDSRKLTGSRPLIDPRQQWSRGPRPPSGAVGRAPASDPSPPDRRRPRRPHPSTLDPRPSTQVAPLPRKVQRILHWAALRAQRQSYLLTPIFYLGREAHPPSARSALSAFQLFLFQLFQ
jgi:hypothetical protein